MTGSIPTRPFGKSGEEVSLLALGGAHIGLTSLDEEESLRLMHAAFDAGVTFLDNAWEYNAGLSEMRMGKAISTWRARNELFVMTKDCAHDRRAENSMVKLEQSLRRLQVEVIDLWQIHEVVWDDDVERIFAPGGSAESLLRAKEQGKVRYIGFTGHKSPAIHKAMLSQGFPFDAVQLPLNALDAHYESFEREIVPICQEQGIAVIAMKSFADGHLFSSGADVTPEEALRYVMSLPVATVVSGMESMQILEQNVAIARAFTPMTEAERAELLSRTKEAAIGGPHEPFKTTRDYDANEGRAANDYPLVSAAD